MLTVKFLNTLFVSSVYWFLFICLITRTIGPEELIAGMLSKDYQR